MQIYHHTEGRAAPTSLVYSAAAYVGWGDLVYLYGNISEPEKTPGCCLGIPAYNKPTIQAIGGVCCCDLGSLTAGA